MTAYTDDWWDGYDQACADLVKILPAHFEAVGLYKIEDIVDHIARRPEFRRTLHAAAERHAFARGEALP